MASFGCNAWAHELLSSAALQQPPLPIAANAPAKIEEPVRTGKERGPGWYDSSWDLRRGLVVHEGMPVDVKLHEWLAGELIGASKELEMCELA